MFVVKFRLWYIVCFIILGGLGCVVRWCRMWLTLSDCCLSCDACSCRCSFIGSVFVSV